MKVYYSQMLCQDVNLYKGDQTKAENYLDLLISTTKTSAAGTSIKFPSNTDAIITSMVSGDCKKSGELMAEPNGDATTLTSEFSDNVLPDYSSTHDQIIQGMIVPFSIHLQAFAPFGTFGFGFEGDGEDRKIGNNRDRYRLYSAFNLQYQAASFESIGKVNTAPTISGWFGKNVQSSETKSVVDLNRSSIPRKANLQILAWAGNDATMQKNINEYWEHNYDTDIGELSNMNIDRTLTLSMEMVESSHSEKILKLSGEVAGEFFPSTDLFISDKNKTQITLGGAPAKIDLSSLECVICQCEAKNCGPFAYLGKPVYKNFGFFLSIKIENGLFKKVVDSAGKEWEVSAWNSKWLLEPTVLVIPK